MGGDWGGGSRGRRWRGGRHGILSSLSFFCSFLLGYPFLVAFVRCFRPGRIPYSRNRGSSPRIMIMGHRLVYLGRGGVRVWGGGAMYS